MTSPDDLTYLLYVDDDVIPLAASMTLGNHLDNDIMVPGEDVADFHLRVEVTPRGPVFVPLGQMTFNINGVETDQALRAIVGDVISVGQSTLQLGFELETQQDELSWRLVDHHGKATPIIGELAIGRAEGADLTIAEVHVSRFHARILEQRGCVWIQDLNSANGTQINAERIMGGVRVFHGDLVKFDRHEYQFVATGADLTPVQQFEQPMRGTQEEIPPLATVNAQTPKLSSTAQLQELQGPHLQAHDRMLVLRVGDNVLGSASECDVQITDESLAPRHAQFNVGADKVRLTNLSHPQATKVNDIAVDNTVLEDGDVLRIGDLTLTYRLPAKPEGFEIDWNRHAKRKIIYVVAGVLGALIIGLLLLT